MWLVKHVAARTQGSDWRGYFLIGCVAVLALLLAGASWSARQSSIERTAAEQRQDQTLQVLLETDHLRSAALQQVRGGRGLVLGAGAVVPDGGGPAVPCGREWRVPGGGHHRRQAPLG